MGQSRSVLAVLLILLAHSRQSGAGSAVAFEDVAAQAGIDVVTYCGSIEKNHIQETSGTGGAFVDYDGDGYLDLYVVNAWRIEDRKVVLKAANVLYRNRGDGTFADVTASTGVGDRSWGLGVCVGDYDNDGQPDMYVTNGGPNLLYRNRGDGSFANLAGAAGVDHPGLSTGCAFLDYDRDGDLDLYAANYVESTIAEVLSAQRNMMWRGVGLVLSGPRSLQGAPDVFYRNDGDGTFTDVTDESGLREQRLYYGYGVCATDFDADGYPDIYVANDTNPNYLYRNNGDGTFTDVAQRMSAGRTKHGMTQAGMGIDSGDYDNDGDFDLIVTNFANDFCALYRNQGRYFEEISPAAGLWKATFMSLSWGTSFIDYDNNGILDLFIANGHIYPQLKTADAANEQYDQANQLFRNVNGRFVDVSQESGPGLFLVRSSRAAIFGDYDNDGDTDIVILNIDDKPNLLRNNGGNSQHWLQVRTVGTKSNRLGIGARLRVRVDSLIQIREIRSGSSHMSQNDMRAHFGLGERTAVDTLVVRWPSGVIDRLTHLPVDRLIVVKEGHGLVAN